MSSLELDNLVKIGSLKREPASPREPGAAALVTQARLSVDLHASGAAQSDDITFLALRRVL